MAVTKAGTVIVVSADNDTIQGPIVVTGIKYIAGTGTPSAQIKSVNTSGVILWETASTTSIFEEAEFRCQEDLHFDLAGVGTLLYIYTEV